MVEKSDTGMLDLSPRPLPKGKGDWDEEGVKLCLVVALHCEARPFIEHFGLKKEVDVDAFEVFSGRGVTLVVSGIGKVRAAAATSFLAARPRGGARERVFFNAGIAGAPRQMEAKTGELYLINRIVDAGSGRETVPDLLLATSLPEAAVVTFDRPVTADNTQSPRGALVDMEASGFAAAASFFAGPHALGCAKVVSDGLEGARLSRDFVTELMAQNVEEIVSYIEKMRRLQGCLEAPLTEAERAWIDVARARLRLTKSQVRALEEAVTARAALELGPLFEIDEICPKRVKTKDEGKQTLERARQRLLRA